MRNILNYLFILIMLLSFALNGVSFSYASITMDEVHKLYQKEKGESWEEATSDERTKFLYEVMGRKKKEDREQRVEGKTVPYYVEEGYLRETKQDWNSATKAEQDNYLNYHKKIKRRNKALDQKDAEAREQNRIAVINQREAKKARIAKKKEVRLKAKENKRRRAEKRRQKSAKAFSNMQKKMSKRRR